MTADDRHERREPANPWLWAYDGYDADTQGLRESLCTLGNGVFATRGALAESTADGVHYPGTYLAGVYNRLATELAGRTVENESLVNAPNWLVLRVVADDGTPFDVEHCTVLDHHVELDMRRAPLVRRSRLAHPDGRALDSDRTTPRELARPARGGAGHHAASRGLVRDRRRAHALDGTVRPASPVMPSSTTTTCASSAPAAPPTPRASASRSRRARRISASPRRPAPGSWWRVPPSTWPARPSSGSAVGQDLTVPPDPDALVTIEKVVALCTSRDDGIAAAPGGRAGALEMAGSFDEVAERHIVSWRHAWDRSRITVVADARTQAVLNLHLLHLLQTVSKNTTEPGCRRAGAGPARRGLPRPSIFWDELFIFPFLNWRVPELTRSLLRYRARRLDMARHLARRRPARRYVPVAERQRRAQETQTMHFNPASGHWLLDASHLQRHVDIAVAYNVGVLAGDPRPRVHALLGAEMLLEIARFASATTYDAVRDCHDIWWRDGA
ncbi:MAG: hypothetical protein R2699_05985 [Acidimicrobiales bacterium]